MKFINKQFNEFKSIFITEDILKENEKHANIVTASTMLNLFIVILISWFLTKLGISKTENVNLNRVIINSFSGLLIPAVICHLFKGEKSWTKYMLLGMFILTLVTIDNNMSYITAFLMVIPVILSARYYKKKFTILTSFVTLALFLIASFAVGINYIENYQTILGALLLYYVVVFASVQISQSGKNMIEKQKEITQKSTRIETELSLANVIQKSMLPSIFPPFPEHEEIDLYATMIPAKEIGGDFYDMFLIDDDHLAICIADVSGKGVPASLVMMITKILIKNVTKIDLQVDKAFTRVNNMLCDGNETGIFITSWFGILNLKTGRIEYVNAGHNPPLLYSKKTNEFTYLETKSNLVLAGLENINYSKQEIKIEPGDRLFLYTDGVVESTNIKNNQYGEERLKEFLNKHINLDSKETIQEVKKDLDIFVNGAEQFDDITMLELIYKNKKKSIKKEFNADIKELSNIQSFAEKELDKYFNKKTINEIKLAVEEVFINIARYAYEEKNGKCSLEIKNDENDFKLIFEDEGIKFNPLEKQDPDISKKAEEREIGGLGIFITKKIVDNIEYKYENNKNILTISKKV